MLFAEKYLILPNKTQKAYLETNFQAARFVYNNALEFKINEWENVKDLPKKQRKTASAFDLMKRLPELKKQHPWLAEADSQALKEAISNLDTAFKNFFRRCRQKNDKPGFPKFKNKYRKQTAKFPQRIAIADNKIKIPKCTPINYRKGRMFPDAQLRSVTITKTASGRYYASILYKDNRTAPEKPPLPDKPADITGLDMNISTFATTTDGEIIENPRFHKNMQKKLRRAQRKLARRQPGSARREQQRLKVAQIYEQIADKRVDFLHQITAQLSNNYATAVEHLEIKQMVTSRKKTKKHQKNINKGFADIANYELRRQLDYKSDWKGTHFIAVDTKQHTNRKHFECGHINDEPRAARDTYTCEHCQQTVSRGINSAKNIQRLAFQQIQEQ